MSLIDIPLGCSMVYVEDGSTIEYDEDDNPIEEVSNDWDEVVITDTQITIPFDYPLKQKFKFTFNSKFEKGFTLRELIGLIVDTYTEIYKKEEETVSVQHFEYKKKCDLCKSSKIIHDVVKLAEDETEVCSICTNNYVSRESLRELSCDHKFHKDCIDKWFEQNETCPLCGKNCFIKTDCKNCEKGTVTLSYVGKILPLDLRAKMGGRLNRHQTDGIYGIWGHDIKDLSIERVSYDSNKKELDVGIGS